jgi:hypothetical protein
MGMKNKLSNWMLQIPSGPNVLILVKQLLIFLQEFLQLFCSHCLIESVVSSFVYLPAPHFGWVDHVLSKFNVGEKCREWVQMLFKYAQTCIKTNGFVSKYFNISRSCRQGEPPYIVKELVLFYRKYHLQAERII